jgi:hypothetical protein
MKKGVAQPPSRTNLPLLTEGKEMEMKPDKTFRLINHKYPFIYPIWGK